MTDKQRLAKLRAAMATLKKTTHGYTPAGTFWHTAFDLLEELEADLAARPPVPVLGPVVKGGQSVLRHDLTHATDGLPGYPAFDDGIGLPGAAVLAPEHLTVTRQSSARRRDGTPNGKAFYATGSSKLKYWFGHVDQAPPVGTKFLKGQKMVAISENHEAPHVHVGINAVDLIGHELAHHTNYTHGAPTVGVQLAKALAT